MPKLQVVTDVKFSVTNSQHDFNKVKRPVELLLIGLSWKNEQWTYENESDKKPVQIDWLSMVLRLHQHNIGYTASTEHNTYHDRVQIEQIQKRFNNNLVFVQVVRNATNKDLMWRVLDDRWNDPC